MPDKISTRFAFADKNTDIIIGITAPPMLIAIVVYILREEAAKPDRVSLALSEIKDTRDLTF